MPRRSELQLPFDLWPDGDRQAWDVLFHEGDCLDEPGAGMRWAPTTRKTNRKRYAGFLGWLQKAGALDPAVSPAERITPEAVDRYARHLIETVAPCTVNSIVIGLKVVAKAIAPRADWRWLDQLCARLKTWAKPSRDPDAKVRPAGEIYRACRAELDRLLVGQIERPTERIAYRDALMAMMLAAAPIRLRNLTMISIGTHLVRSQAGFELRFRAEETKNRRPLRLDLPVDLTRYIEIYLERITPRFEGTFGAALWVGCKKAPLASETIYQHIGMVTKRLLGVSINPHAFRACAATTMAHHSSAAARMAAPLLGHAYFGTTERYYIRARQIESSRRVIALLRQLKAEKRKG